MKESVREFIEKNILALEEDIVLFLYLASVQLTREDANILCSYLDTAGIEYKNYIPDVIEELVKNNIALKYRRKTKLSDIVDNIPFHITEPLQFRNIVKDAITKIYPNKIILPDRYNGIEYVMEKI